MQPTILVTRHGFYLLQQSVQHDIILAEHHTTHAPREGRNTQHISVAPGLDVSRHNYPKATKTQHSQPGTRSRRSTIWETALFVSQLFKPLLRLRASDNIIPQLIQEPHLPRLSPIEIESLRQIWPMLVTALKLRHQLPIRLSKEAMSSKKSIAHGNFFGASNYTEIPANRTIRLLPNGNSEHTRRNTQKRRESTDNTSCHTRKKCETPRLWRLLRAAAK